MLVRVVSSSFDDFGVFLVLVCDVSGIRGWKESSLSSSVETGGRGRPTTCAVFRGGTSLASICWADSNLSNSSEVTILFSSSPELTETVSWWWAENDCRPLDDEDDTKERDLSTMTSVPTILSCRQKTDRRDTGSKARQDSTRARYRASSLTALGAPTCTRISGLAAIYRGVRRGVTWYISCDESSSEEHIEGG